MSPISRNAVLLLAIGAGTLGCATTTEAPVEEREAGIRIERDTAAPTGSDGLANPGPGTPGRVDGTLPAPADSTPPAGAIKGGEDAIAAPVPPAAVRAGPAVVALLSRAESQQRAGSGDAAAATLERALKIEPHNPLLWHRLARLRLVQSRLDDTLVLAARSNALARDDGALMASNWRLIARVHEARGETAAARTARQRAARLDPQTS